MKVWVATAIFNGDEDIEFITIVGATREAAAKALDEAVKDWCRIDNAVDALDMTPGSEFDVDPELWDQQDPDEVDVIE